MTDDATKGSRPYTGPLRGFRYIPLPPPTAQELALQQKLDALMHRALSALDAWRCPECAGSGAFDFAMTQDPPTVTVRCRTCK